MAGDPHFSLGIDLGTTFCSVASASGGSVEMLSLGNRTVSIPSVVFVRDDGEVLVGDAAETRGVAEPSRVAREFKRRLGDPTPLFLGGTPYGAETLTALLLRTLYQRAVDRIGRAPDNVVITHPAAYSQYRLDRLRDAVRQAEVPNVTLLSEPEAAAISYGSTERIAPGEVIAVYDFGGGTFDAALVRRTPTGFELLGDPQGIEQLGGVDFDLAILDYVLDALGERAEQLSRADDPTSLAALSRLRADCRSAKETLSEDGDATVPVFLPSGSTEVHVSRAEFEAMIRPRLAETVQALERAVRSANLTMADVSRVLLVGGSSRIPIVRFMVRTLTGRPVAVDADPQTAIALGAARHAAALAAGDAPTTVLPATDNGPTLPPATAAGLGFAAPAAAAAAASATPPAGSWNAPAPGSPPPTTPVGSTPPPSAPQPPTAFGSFAGGSGTPPQPPSGSTPGASGAGKRRNMIIAAVVAVAAIVIIAVVALGGGDDKKKSTDTTVPDTFSLPTDQVVTEPPTVPDTTPLETFPLETIPAETTTTLPPPVVIPLQATITWAGLEISLTSATYSAIDHDIEFTGTIASPLATRTTSLVAVYVSSPPFVDYAGSQYPGDFRAPSSDLPVAAKVATDIRITSLPDGFDPAQAKLVLGAGDEHQAIIPLDGSAPTSEPTMVLPITGTVSAPNQTTFAIQSVAVMAASCDGTPDKITFAPAKAKKVAIVARGTFGSTSDQSGGVGINLGSGPITLLQPNGISAITTPEAFGVVGIGTPPLEDYSMCFLVDAPAVGTYTLSIPVADPDGNVSAGTFDIVIPDPNAPVETTTVAPPPDTTPVAPPTEAPTTVAAP